MKTTGLKNILATMMLIAVIASGKAQMLSAGFAGGITTGSVRIEDVGRSFGNVIEGKNIYGYEAGLFAKLNMGPLYVKGMGLYSFRTGDVNFQQTTNGVTSTRTTQFNLYKIETPVLLGINLLGPLSIEGGPVYNYIISSTDRFNDVTVSMGNSALGYRLGAAAEMGPLILNLSYQGVTYNVSGTKATFREPYKIIFGAALKLGSGMGSSSK